MPEPEDERSWDAAPPRPKPDADGSIADGMRPSTVLPTSVPKSRLRGMVERLDRRELSIDAAAEELGIDLESLHRYYRAHSRLHEDEGAKAEPNPSILGRDVPEELQDTFSGNWDRNAEMFEPEVVEPSMLARALSLTPLTRWMAKEGRVEKSSFTGVVTLLVLSAIVAIAIATNREGDGSAVVAEESEEAKAMPSRITESAETAIRSFLEADGWEAKLPFIRHPEANRPHLEAWGKEGKAKATPRKFVFFEEQFALNGARFMRFSAFEQFGGTPSEVFVEVTEAPFRVDWKAFSVWQPMDWGAFVQERPEGVFDFRVTASISKYHNYEFTDEDVWLSIELRPASTDPPLYAFVDRRGELGGELANVFLTQKQLAESSVKVLLALSFSESPTHRDTVGIQSLVSPNWVSP